MSGNEKSKADKVDNTMAAAQQVVETFVAEHRGVAIPALIGACAMWAVQRGGSDLIKSALESAVDLVEDMDKIVKDALK
jgi:hypothetical protein